MTYITKDKRTKWEGGSPDENGYLCCDQCGSRRIHMTSHFDGPKIYGYDYRCECGAHIRKTTKRRPEEVWA